MNQVNVTLYKLNSSGKQMEWSIFTNEDGKVLIKRGLTDGKIAESSTQSIAKSIGKSNETTPAQQAVKDALSKWKKQLDKNYVENLADIDEPLHLLAPLALKYQKYAKHVNWEEGVVCLTKYDGVRMTAFYRSGKAFFQTRGGKYYPLIKEIADELHERFWEANPALVIDGELYNHDLHLEDITSGAKSSNEYTKKLDFYVFDAYDPNSPDIGYLERLRYVELSVSGCERVKHAKWFVCTSEERMYIYHDNVVKNGYEGVILRSREGLFEFGTRNISFIKYKVRHRAEYVTVKPILCKNGSVKIMCKVVFDGEVKFFEPPMLGTIPEQRRVFDDWGMYDTGHGTIEYEAISKYGIPAKAKFISFRILDLDGNPLV